MCGIIGIWSKNNLVEEHESQLQNALQAIKHRGPDNQNYKLYSNCYLGHARLSVIDTDERSNQPFYSKDNRYALVFNGEIYNFKKLRLELEKDGAVFETDSDTEVLFFMLIKFGVNALEKLNGFFAFAFYDFEKNEVIIVRDRFGIKPLMVGCFNDVYLFGSELNSILEFNQKFNLNFEAINYYFGLTYIPAPFTLFNEVKKVMPGQYAVINSDGISFDFYYNQQGEIKEENYDQAKKKLYDTLDKSVERRLVSDVPLGCFLSGGVDSSIIAALAKKKKPNLKTFSIGFDHPYFNESDYAEEVAKHIGSDHTTYLLTKEDFKSNFADFLKAIDEPFADSSAFAVYLLSYHTRKNVTVALSGDGADELFGGYRKHMAEWHIQNTGGAKKALIQSASGVLNKFRINRSDKFGDFNRKLNKLSKGLKLSPKQRYWEWCNFIQSKDRKELLLQGFEETNFLYSNNELTDINDVLLADQKLVLPNDMLKKVDLMSMRHALEVRTPFLDHEVVELANSFPESYKVDGGNGKRILKEAFSDLLPESIFNRSKKGFEIPIKEWLNEEIETELNKAFFSKDYLKEQGIFKYDKIMELKTSWNDKQFGDRIYAVWALIVFQNWWNNHVKHFA